MADDLSNLLGDLPPDLVNGLNGDSGGGDYALSAYQDSSLASDNLGTSPALVLRGKPSLARAARLLGAAITYFGAGALQGLLPAIASYLQVDSGKLLMSFLGKKGRGRRRRGITFRQLSNARRVNRTIDRMYHSLHKGQHHGGGFRIQPARHKKGSR